jgi:hypothetical protein
MQEEAVYHRVTDCLELRKQEYDQSTVRTVISSKQNVNE